MKPERNDGAFESLSQSLNDAAALKEYKERLDTYSPSLLPRLLGKLLVILGNCVYGAEPTYLKFRAVEVIARVPYHSWASAAYTLLTLFYSNQKKAMTLSQVTKFARLAQDNETMHVVVISHLANEAEHSGVIRHTFIPMLFALFYFWWSYILYLLNPRYSYELNYMFENHAFGQYDRFLTIHETELRAKPVHVAFLEWYGRYPSNQFEFFRSVRNDEIIHRNESIGEIRKLHT